MRKHANRRRQYGYRAGKIVIIGAGHVGSAILFDSHSMLPLCVIPQGEYGPENVAMSLPIILGERGVEKILTLPLDEDAERGMCACDEYLRSIIHDIDIHSGSVHHEGWLGGFPPQQTNSGIPSCH